MPQLEIATYASQIFWLAIVFVILYFYLAKSSLPVIREVLQNRQLRISSDLSKAETLKREAEAASHDYASLVTSARQKAHSLLSDAKARVAEEDAVRNAKIEQNFAHQSKEAERRIVELRKEATAKLIPVAAGSAALIVERILGTKVDAAYAESVALEVSKEINNR